jgi:hypothetical protein
MFIEILYRRTIEGFKDMTRRCGGLEMVNGTKKEPLDPDEWVLLERHYTNVWPGNKNGERPNKLILKFRNKKTSKIVFCTSGYHMLEKLYLKEPTVVDADGNLHYKFDKDGYVPEDGWDNKMFMGENKARQYIEIQDIDVEQLNDISIKDCIREGVPMMGHRKASNALYKIEHPGMRINEQTQFFSIYRVANNLPAGKALPNIWVFIYTFKLITDQDLIKTFKEYGKP